MYAIVHPSCAPHSAPLVKLGYELLVKDHPVKKEDIKGSFLRDHIESENCCGSAEFIKLYGELLICKSDDIIECLRTMLTCSFHNGTTQQQNISNP